MKSVVTLYLEVVGGSWKREIQPSSGIEPLTAGADETSTPPVQAGFCAKTGEVIFCASGLLCKTGEVIFCEDGLLCKNK